MNEEGFRNCAINNSGLYWVLRNFTRLHNQ